MWPNPDDPREPKWTDEDRAWAIALTMEESEVCPGCGRQLAECSDPRNEFGYKVTAWKCHACTAKDTEGEQYRNNSGTYYLSVSPR